MPYLSSNFKISESVKAATASAPPSISCSICFIGFKFKVLSKKSKTLPLNSGLPVKAWLASSGSPGSPP